MLKRYLKKTVIKLIEPVIKQVIQEMAHESIGYKYNEDKSDKIEILYNFFFEVNLRKRHERLNSKENDTRI